MNRGINILAVLMLFVAIACNDKVDRSKGNNSEILKTVPFSGLTDSIRQFPSEPELYLQRGLLLSQHNMHDLATPDYKKAWELTNEPAVAMEYASNLFLVNKIDEAVALLKEGQEKFPDNTEFGRRLGEVYAQRGQYDQALKQYNSILSIDSTDFETLYYKGVMLAQANDTPAAIESLEKSFQQVPAFFSGLALANLYASTKNARALEISDFLIARDTTDQAAHAYYLKGIYYSAVNKADAALGEFKNAINRNWKFVDAYIDSGIIFFERKDYDQALEIFIKAATVANTDADAYYWIARTYEAKGNRKEASENYERAIALEPMMFEARDRLKKLSNP